MGTIGAVMRAARVVRAAARVARAMGAAATAVVGGVVAPWAAAAIAVAGESVVAMVAMAVAVLATVGPEAMEGGAGGICIRHSRWRAAMWRMQVRSCQCCRRC